MSTQTHTQAKTVPKLAFTPASTGLLQRKCTCGGTPGPDGECAACRQKRLALQRQPMHAHQTTPATIPPIVRDVLRSPGQPLDATTRTTMESRFTHDFSQVRIHANPQAAESAQAVNAQAYTVGQNVVFGTGRYAPTSNVGQRLLAHELTHVVQQSQGIEGSEQTLEAQANVQESQYGNLSTNSSAQRPNTLTRMQRKPDSITEITVNLANSIIQVSLDDGNAITGIVDEANLLPGNYQARWDARTNGLIITPFLTREEVIHFNVKGTSTFLRRYDRLRRSITAPIPFNVVSQAPIEVSPTSQGAASSPPVQTTPGVNYLTPEEARQRCESGDLPGVKVFPLRLPRGIWRTSIAPISAHREGEDIVVRQTVSGVMGDPMFRQEVRTLPTETFLSGVRLKPNEIVRVKLYDQDEREVCVTGEGMLELSKASDRATFISILTTVVDAALFMVPASVVARPLAAVARVGRTGLAAAMIGTAEAAPTALGGVASRAAVTAVEERAVAGLTEQATTRTITQSITRAAEQGLVREAAPAAVEAALPGTAGRLATQATVRGTGIAATEATGGAVERAFTEHALSGESQPYATTQRLIRGNVGERLATEALAADGHQILIYKPSILGTNQGGIDIITMRDNLVYLIDNKALTRAGNVSSVSSLTTNFAQNLAAIEDELAARLAEPNLLAAQRQVLQQALNSLRSGNYVRAVTNANVAPDTQILSGVTQQLQNQGIQFINVF